VRVFVPEDRDEALRLTGLITRAVPTDDAGNFAIPMPPDGVPDLLLLARTIGVGSSGSIPLRWTGETQKDVTLRLRR
jgi:hypothetical protein